MVLHELHVFQRSTGTVGERHAIAILDVGIGGERKHASASAGAQDDGFRRDGLDFAGHQLDGHNALHASIVHQQLGDEPLVVARDGIELQAGLKERVQHVEAGLVRGEPRAFLLHAAKRPNGDVPVGLAVPGTSPPFQLQQLQGRFLYEGLNRILIAEPIAAGNRVVRVLVLAVVGLGYTGGSALGGNGVAAHGIDLGNDGDAELGIDFRRGDRRAKSRTASTYQKNVVRRSFHGPPRAAAR